MSRDPELFWKKVDVILKPVGGLLTALAVGGVGFFGSQFLERRQSAETNVRLYAELMSRRETSDTGLRKGMFDTIIANFLKPKAEGGATVENILALELLAYNFHDALDLGPLFKHVDRQINSEPESEREGLRRRLQKVATEVIQKQLSVLDGVGYIATGTQRFDHITEDAVVISRTLGPDDDNGTEYVTEPRFFELEVLDWDVKKGDVEVVLVVSPDETSAPEIEASFHVGFFDFPMIDNTRLRDSTDRCAVVLTKLTDRSADLSIVYFPGSRASLKEKPYYDEVIEDLTRTRAALEREANH